MGDGPIIENCRASWIQVCYIGFAGGIGQPLTMLMKMNHLVSVLHLYDVVNAPGVIDDISHMDTGVVYALNVEQYEVAKQLREKLGEALRHQESRRGSSSKSEAQDMVISILHLQIGLQKTRRKLAESIQKEISLIRNKYYFKFSNTFSNCLVNTRKKWMSVKYCANKESPFLSL